MHTDKTTFATSSTARPTCHEDNFEAGLLHQTVLELLQLWQPAAGAKLESIAASITDARPQNISCRPQIALTPKEKT